MIKLLMLLALTGTLSAAGPSFASCANSPNADYKTKTATLIAPYVSADRFSGIVLIACDGNPIFRQGFGLANREWGIATTPDTKYRLGSITKIFTAIAILQLAEQGKLSLDDPVSKYYVAAPVTWRKITIKNLLTHQSGIPDYAEPHLQLPMTVGRIDRTPEELIGLFRDKPLEFEPGSQVRYSNSGYVVLGAIIEKLSGRTYADYVQKYIFEPLGMRDFLGNDSSEKIIAHRGAGYIRVGEQWINAPYLAMSFAYAAGSLYSTADDLLLLDQALYATRLLSTDFKKLMFMNYGRGWGLGWNVFQQYGHEQLAKEGKVNGFYTGIARYPDDKLTIIVLSNLEEAPIEDIFADLKHLYLGIPK